MRPRPTSVILPALAVLALLLAGCAAKRPVGADAARPAQGAATARATEDFDVFSGEYENTPEMLANPPRSVAVLPFGGDPQRWLGAGKDDPRPVIRRAMYNHLSSLPFSDLELYDTDARLAEMGIAGPGAVARAVAEDPAGLHRALGVDAVVLGEVTHFDRAFAGIVSQAAVGCTVRMVALPSGKLLWRAEHVSRGFGGGVSVTPVGLILSAFSSLWNLRDDQLLRETDALFREITATIHAPGAAESARAARAGLPGIDLFAVMDPGAPFTEGHPVVMRLVGDPGGRAFAEISGTGRAVDLAPAPAPSRRAIRAQLRQALARRYADLGARPEPAELDAALAALDQREIYEGAYYPEPGTEQYGATVRAVLTSGSGARATRLFERRIDIDAAPPAAPENLRADPGSGRVALAWDPVDAPDLAAYEVLASKSGLSGFAPVARAAEPAATVTGLADFSPVFLRVVALDKAGNRSVVSRAAKALPLPVPGLADHAATSARLGGTVEGVLFLPAELSPYFVERGLTVPTDAELHVAPGAVLRFAPGTGLTVNGSLFCWGDAERPVRLVPESPAAKPGTWSGLTLDGAVRARLTATHILGARVGVTVRHSAPRLDGCVIRASSQAGLLLGDGARPDLTCSLVRGNGGMGGLVAEGTGLAPTVRDTAFAANEPFDVQNFAPVDLDLTGNWFASDPALTVLGRAVTRPALPAPPARCQIPIPAPQAKETTP